MRYFIHQLLCLLLFIPICSQAQIIQYGEVYGDDGSSHQGAWQSVIDKEGGRYTLVETVFSDFTVDSAGTPVTITPIIDNGPGCKTSTLVILKFDSTGRYEYHCKIQTYKKRICEASSSNIIMRMDPSNQLTFCATVGELDSIDFVDSRGILYKRARIPNTQDSTFIFIGKLATNGQFQWINTINRISQAHVMVPSYVPAGIFRFTKNASTLTLTDAGESKIDLDLYELYQPYIDTLLLTYDNGSTAPINTQGQDLRLTFSNTGSLIHSVSPFRLRIKNTADHMEMIRSVTDGINTYNLLHIRLDSKDTFEAPVSIPIDSGESMLLVKTDDSDSIVWAKLIGTGNAFNFNLDYNDATEEIALGFYFVTWTFINSTLPVTPSSYGGTYIAKINSSGDITWNTIYGNNTIYTNLNSLTFNPKNNGLILIGQVAGFGTQLQLENYTLTKVTNKEKYFIALFDSLNQCVGAEILRFPGNTNNAYIAWGGDLGKGSPITDQKGRTYITGTFMDTISFSCNKFINTINPSGLYYDGFVLVTNPPASIIDTGVCYNMVSLSGKYVYDSTGFYTDTLTTVGGCDSLVIIKVKVLATKSTIDTAVCYVYISPSGKYAADSNMTIQDTIPNKHGCDSVMTIHVRILSNTAEIDTAVCYTLLSPSTLYTWNADGTYLDTVTNTNGCDSIITIHLVINHSSSTLDTTYCGAIISPSGNHLYTAAGNYLDTMTNAKGCDSIITVQYHKGDLTSTVSVQSCSVVNSPSGKYHYNTSGIYSDTISSVQHCDSIITLSVTIDSFVVAITKSNDVTCDTPFALLTVTNGLSYNWSPKEFLNDAHISNPIATPKEKTMFYVQVQDTMGCAASDSIEVDVNKKETITDLPNVFTPNDDGMNDCLKLKSVTSLKSVSITIFNRWGNKVFQSNDPNDCWNGKNLSGQNESDGVYYFILDGVSMCDTKITQTGTIELIR